MFHAILSLCLVGCALAQVPFLGSCPNVDTVPDFNLEKYMGKWFEARRYFADFEVGSKCVTADHHLNDDGTVTIDNSEILLLTRKVLTLRSTARVPDPAKPAQLKSKVVNDPTGIERDYFVLGTDYENYAVVYRCYGIKFLNFKNAWILTRERNPPQSVIDEAIAVAEKNHLHRSIFLKSDQTHC